MTELWVLCAWNGWFRLEGTNLVWVVEDDGTLTIKDGTPSERVCSHAAGSWRAVTYKDPMEHP